MTRARSRNPALLKDSAQMLLEILLDGRLSTNRIIVKNHPITADVKRKLLSSLSQQDRGFIEGMSISEFIEYVLVRCSDLGDNHVGFRDRTLDVLEDDSRPGDLVYAKNIQAMLYCFRLDYFSINCVERL